MEGDGKVRAALGPVLRQVERVPPVPLEEGHRAGEQQAAEGVAVEPSAAHVVPGVAGGDAEALEVLTEVPVGVAPVLAAGRAGLAGAVPAHSRRMTMMLNLRQLK